MTQSLYDIYFTGQLIEGTNQEVAKKYLVQLFKTNTDNIAKLFNGKAHILKRGVDKEQALKYKAALHKAGLLIVFKAHQASANTKKPQNAESTANTNSPAATPTKHEQTYSLAPVGSDLLQDGEKQVFETREVDIHHIKLVSAFAEPVVQEKHSPPAPDISHISIADVGESLSIDLSEQIVPPVLNLDDLSLAPVGVDLEQLQDNRPPVTPNTNGISIAPVGADLQTNVQKSRVPPPPNTEHISIAEK